MKLWVLAATAFLLGITAMGAPASDRIDGVNVGSFSVSFTPASGFQVQYGGATLFTESSLHVVRPCWVTTYYAYENGGEKIDVADIEGGKLITVKHHTSTFDGEHRVTVLKDKITFDLRYKLTTDSKDAGIEYNIGYLAAPLLVGRSFASEVESGTVSLGTIDGGWNASLTKNPFKKLSIDSRIGKITIEGNGDPGPLQLNDCRGLHVDWAEKSPIFMLTAPRLVLKEDEEHRSIVSISVEPNAKPVSAVTIQGSTMVKDVKDLRKTAAPPVVVIPEPKSMQITRGDFLLTDRAQIVVGDTAADEDLRGVRSFADEVFTRYRIRIPVVTESEASARNLILVGEQGLNKKLKQAVDISNMAVPSNDEGYAIRVQPHRIIVAGHDRKGTFYGIQTLKQLIKASYESTSVQGCTISDFPSLEYRGALLFTGNEALPFHEKLVDRIFSRFKMNNLMLECDFIKWDSAPEIAQPFAVSHEDLRKDIKYAQDHFMEVTPHVGSFAVRWLFGNKQHLDIAEDPMQPYTYCPSKQESYDLIFKIYDELIDIFHTPKYVHIGHDEITWDESKFPNDSECKKKSIADHFIDDTTKIYNHIRSKGPGVMMWSDMMLSPGTSPDACNMPDPKDAEHIRRTIPSDIVVTDWHYDIGKPQDFKSIRAFQEAGHKTIAATWYTPDNIRNFSQTAKDDHAAGLLQTVWSGTNSNERNLTEAKSQFTAFVLAAEYAWNSGKTSLEKLPYTAEEAFFNAWNQESPKRECLKGFTIDLSNLYNVPLTNKSAAVWVGKSPEADLSSAPAASVRLANDLFRLARRDADNSALRLSSAIDTDTTYPASVNIAIGQKAESLLFLHTCAWADTTDRLVGKYVVHYQNGDTAEIPLIYRSNISAWTDCLPCSSARIAWKDADRQICLREMEWKNPKPDLAIESIDFQSAATNAGPVLFGISGLTK